MSDKLICPECESADIVLTHEFRDSGRPSVALVCDKCKFAWSVLRRKAGSLLAVEAPAAPVVVPPPPPVDPVEPDSDSDVDEVDTDNSDAPEVTTDGKTLITVDDGFDVETLEVGQEVQVSSRDEILRGKVNRIGAGKRGKVNIEVPGEKDRSVGKKSVLGRFEDLAE